MAHSPIQPGICLFTQGRHKEIRGVREGERVREELSSHIWVDGTHGGINFGVVWSFSPFLLHNRSCFLCSSTFPCLLLRNSPPSVHVYPSASSLSHLYFLFLPHRSTLYSLRSPPSPSKAIPDVAVWAPIAFCHFFFNLCYRKWAPLLKKKKKKRKEEQRKRVVGFREALGERLMTKMYFQNSRLSFHSCTWSNAWAHIRIYTLLKNALLALGILTLVVTFFFELSIHPWLYL